MTHDKSPAAFPCEQHETIDGSWNQTFEPGMSLRDYFAGQAIMGFVSCADEKRRGWSIAQECETAYSYADAMLVARAVRAAQ
jgi:hypothetical protein